MLPFTKRPGRDESGDEDVVTKDDLITAETNVSSRAPASPREGVGRAKLASINDEEMTTLMPHKTVNDALATAVAARAATPRPAAGAPPPSRSTASSRPGSIPPPAGSRPGKFATQESHESDEEDGRTIVRGHGPKIVKRPISTSPPPSGRGNMGGPTLPTTISPAAVIKATLESARAGVKPRTDHASHLMAGPPRDLLEDLADMTGSRREADVGAEHTAILKSPTNPPPGMIQGVKALSTQMLQPQGVPHGTNPTGSSRPMSNPPPPNANQSGGHAAQSGSYGAQYNGPIPSGSVSVPGVAMPQSMPAHFMMPHAPYSDARVDPPGTAVTSRLRVGGRPAMSWALALAAFGVFVGVGAIAVMNGNDNVKETSASFVDPSRAAGGPTARTAAAQPVVAVAPTGVPVSIDPPTSVGAPPVAVPATVAAATDAVAAPIATAPAPAVAVAAPAPVPAVAVAAAPAAAPRPTAVAAAVPRPAPAPAAPRATSKPAAQAAAGDDAPVAAAPTTKSAKGAKPGKGGGEMDDETKKALDELQKAQLERSF